MITAVMIRFWDGCVHVGQCVRSAGRRFENFATAKGDALRTKLFKAIGL